MTQKVVRPPVPLFLTPQENALRLRQIELGPPKPEDNYEISDHGGDSDAEEQQPRRDRPRKAIPKWCENYSQMLLKQADVDPDSIFGNRVPLCSLEEVFKDDLYTQVGKDRPVRSRGSSGEWHKDPLTNDEVQKYKSRMGHTRQFEKGQDKKEAS